MGAKRIVLVGHCGPDSFALRNAIQSFAPGAIVETVSTEDAAARAALSSDLLVINRVLDGDFTTESGIELMRHLTFQGIGAKLMLVSNFPLAQEEAEAVGAIPGFGKKTLYAESTRQRIRDALDLG